MSVFKDLFIHFVLFLKHFSRNIFISFIVFLNAIITLNEKLREINKL